MDNRYISTPSQGSTIEAMLKAYPPFFLRAYEEGKTVLLSGINFDKISFTETAYFLLREPEPLEGHSPGGDNIKVNNENLSTLGVEGASTSEICQTTKILDKDDRNEKLENETCFCKKANDPGDDHFMMACDNCITWFHPLCYRVSKYQRSRLNDKNITWYCKKCMTP